MSPKKPIPKPGPFAGLQKPKNRVIFIAIFTIVHMGLSALLLYFNYQALSTSQASGKVLSAGERLIGRLSEVFQWPLVTYLGQNESLVTSLPAYSYYVALFFNSLFWAVIILLILSGINRFARRRSKGRR